MGLTPLLLYSFTYIALMLLTYSIGLKPEFGEFLVIGKSRGVFSDKKERAFKRESLGSPQGHRLVIRIGESPESSYGILLNTFDLISLLGDFNRSNRPTQSVALINIG